MRQIAASLLAGVSARRRGGSRLASITTKALGIRFPFLPGKSVPRNLFMSSIRAMTRLRLVLYVMGSLAFGSDVHRLMQPTLDRNFCPGWTRISDLLPVSLSSKPGFGTALGLSEFLKPKVAYRPGSWVEMG